MLASTQTRNFNHEEAETGTDSTNVQKYSGPRWKLKDSTWTEDYDMLTYCEIREALNSADAEIWKQTIKNEKTFKN